MKNNPNASKRECDISWDDWNGKSIQPEALQSMPVGINPHHGGEHVTKAELRAEGEKIIEGAKRAGFKQATNEELFGHLIKSKEEINKMEKDWENFFNDTMQEARKNVDNRVKRVLPPELQEQEWHGGSYNDMLSEEEVKERDKYVGK